MDKVTSSVVKGLAVGAVLGTATYLLATPKKSKTAKNMKRNASKAAKTVGTVMENVAYMLK